MGFAAGTASLVDVYSAQFEDNFSTDTPRQGVPDSYKPAVFQNGVVYTTQQENTIPLKLFYSESRHDYLNIASEEGFAYAKENNYKDMNKTVGWIYPADHDTSDPSIADRRW